MPACKPALSYETVIITNHLLFLSLYFSLLYFKVLLHKHVSRIEPTWGRGRVTVGLRPGPGWPCNGVLVLRVMEYCLAYRSVYSLLCCCVVLGRGGYFHPSVTTHTSLVLLAPPTWSSFSLLVFLSARVSVSPRLICVLCPCDLWERARIILRSRSCGRALYIWKGFQPVKNVSFGPFYTTHNIERDA